MKNNVNKRGITTLTATKFDWLCVLRDQLTEQEILERRVNELHGQIGMYYRGELKESDGFRFNDTKKHIETLKKVLGTKEKVTSSILAEIHNLNSPLNTIVVDYLTDTDLSISGLGEIHGLTYEDTYNLLRKVEYKLSGRFNIGDGELEDLRLQVSTV